MELPNANGLRSTEKKYISKDSIFVIDKLKSRKPLIWMYY